MVLEYPVWGAPRRARDGADAGGGAFHKRRVEGERYHRDEGYVDTVH